MSFLIIIWSLYSSEATTSAKSNSLEPSDLACFDSKFGSHFLKAAVKEGGTGESENETRQGGIEERSSSETARIPYCSAKASAVTNSADLASASLPTYLKGQSAWGVLHCFRC